MKIRSAVNPYDPEWELYLEERLSGNWKKRWQVAVGSNISGKNRRDDAWSVVNRCEPARKTWHIHHRIWRSRGGPDTADNLELLHANCHRQIHVHERTDPAASREGRS